MLFSPNSDEDQKKKIFTKKGTLFSPNSSGHLRSDAHQSQTIGGYADVDHTQTIGGVTVKLLGGYILPGFRHPCIQCYVTYSLTKVTGKIAKGP